jgi:hypothetical protein
VFKKLFNNDPTCVCDAVVQAQKVAKEYKLNGTMYDGLETFRLCDMPTTSCEPGKPGEEMHSFLVIHVEWIIPYTAHIYTAQNN